MLMPTIRHPKIQQPNLQNGMLALERSPAINTGYSLLISHIIHVNVILQVNRVIDVTRSDIGFPPWVDNIVNFFVTKKNR